MTPSDVERDVAESLRWIKDWREGMFDSGSRDAEGWPIEMHGLAESYETVAARLAAVEAEREAAELERAENFKAFIEERNKHTMTLARVRELEAERDEAWELLGEDAGTEWRTLQAPAIKGILDQEQDEG